MPKNVQTTAQLHSSHKQRNAQKTSSVASIVHKPGTSDVQPGFRKGKGTRDQIANIIGSHKKQDNSRKISIYASLTALKPLCGSQKCGKF